MSVKYELQNLIQGKSGDSQRNLIRASVHYLRASKETGISPQGNEYTKDQEAEKHTTFIDENELWYKPGIDWRHKIGEGAAQSCRISG